MSEINEIALKNKLVLELYSWYLNENPKAISKKLVDDFSKSCEIDSHYAFYLLFINYLGLDITEQKEHKLFAEEYIYPYLKELNMDKYLNNPYFKNVLPKESKNDNWEIKYQTYQPYELFIWKDLTITKDFKEFPNIAYFKKEFKYLTVFENNHEWMMITPNEIETMEEAIKNAFGSVITFGLGLGYFPYMVSLKNNVNKITIIEKEQAVIDLFKREILPFFEHKNKIEIIKTDAFDFLKTNKIAKYDFSFVDLWHDVSDGIPLYLKFKQYEKTLKKVKFMYWIEESLLSYLRWYFFENVEKLKKNGLIKEKISFNDFLRKESILKLVENKIL